MALRFMDGFDHYPSSEILNKWTSVSGGVSFTTGRFGGSCLTLTNRSAYFVLDERAEWITSFAFNMNSANPTGKVLRLVESAGATAQVTLYFDGTTGKFRIYRGDVTTLLDTSVDTFALNTWYFVEFRVVVHNSTGVAHLKVDGADVLNLTSQDTQAHASTATASRFLFGDGGAAIFVDDLNVLDSSGSAPYNTFLGDCRIEAIYPNGNGNSSQFLGQDANSTDNYLNVDEVDSDDDTTYNQSSVVGEKDTYAYSNLTTATGTVYGVQILPWARKTDAGSRSIVTVARVSSTEVDSSAISLPSSYTYVAQDIRTTKPGGGAWTITDVNAAEFGVKVNA